MTGYTAPVALNVFFVARFEANGTLDTTFGSGGVVTTAMSAEHSEAYHIALAGNGSIVVTGYVESTPGDFDIGVARYTQGGALDTTFSGDGKASVSWGAGGEVAFGVALADDGSVVVGGSSEVGVTSDLAFARLTPTGILDATFDGDGKLLIDVAAGEDQLYDVAIQPNGSIVSTGFGTVAGSLDTVIVRRLASGAPDATFDGDGTLVISNGAANDSGRGVLAADGAITIGGVANPGAGSDIAVTRFGAPTIPDYDMGVNDFDQGGGAFGACLRVLGGSAVVDAWPVDACSGVDGVGWRDVPAAPEQLAHVTLAGQSGTVGIRFGLRPAPSQAPSTFAAPVMFEVLAP